ncbi:hypothetical protein [Xenorhabdus indica]|uniref:hypothetical protein n=1 Tax=Xenorhabdus indica TaxID=333964 RepID=UPI001656E490|nr:hypothetical protein [Xenorhabdus indica]MBC8946806.1 hypothetical protein [Xenorhabdus indica]
MKCELLSDVIMPTKSEVENIINKVHEKFEKLELIPDPIMAALMAQDLHKQISAAIQCSVTVMSAEEIDRLIAMNRKELIQTNILGSFLKSL